MNIQKVFENFQNKQILIIGDAMLDSYIWGDVKRISPEAPVPIINIRHEEKRLGGAANVAKNIVELEAKPILCTVIGEDITGRSLEKILIRNNISTQGIIRNKERVTTTKQRILAHSQHILRIDTEINTSISTRDMELLLQRIKRFIDKVSVIIFQDYDKGVLIDSLIKEVIFLAKEKGIPTAVDPKNRNFFSYTDCTLFKPNFKELTEGMKMKFESMDFPNLRKTVNKLVEKMPVEKIMVTLSEKGVYITDLKKEHHIPAHRRKITDVSGAGDTMISIAALCLSENLPMEIIAEIANLGGGLVCEHTGVVPINKKTLLSELIKYYK